MSQFATTLRMMGLTLLMSLAFITQGSAAPKGRKAPKARKASPLLVQGKNAIQIIKDVRKRLWDQSSKGEMEMKIVRPSWQRALKMKIWMKGADYSFVRILTPQRERGIASLKRKSQMWNYMPRAAMVIKVPASMMLSSWMGSDFTNDDLIRASDILTDYTATISTQKTKKGVKQAAITLVPKPDAPVVWGKIVMWVRTKDLQPMSQEYFNEKGKKLRIMEFLDHKMMGGRLFPSKLRMRVLSKPGHRTEMKYLSMQFNQRISRRVFTLRNLKKKNW